jgi:hypothetical protein
MMHTFGQPASKNQQAMPAAMQQPAFTRVDEISMTADKTYNNISPNLPHNFSHIPSSEQMIQPCGCAKCADCDKEENELAGNKNEAIQHKLTVSQPGDPFEREADHVAEQVMNTPGTAGLDQETPTLAAPSVSRWTGNSGDIGREEGEEEPGENTAETEEVEQEKLLNISSLLSSKGRSNKIRTPSTKITKQIHSMHGGGKPMDAALRNFFEPRFQRDFSNVRLHTDARAAETTKSLNARAYTVGEDIAVSPEEYQPNTPAGRKLLAHELTHVVQQSNRVQTIMRACDCKKLGATDPDSTTEGVLTKAFPNLKKGDYCVTGSATPKYNCYAWSVGITNQWMEKVVDTYGNNNGVLEFSDFDRMYATAGLKPVIGKTDSKAEIALYGKNGKPTHAARKTGTKCGDWESKLGENVRISHYPQQIAGGPVYGDINRYYVRK